MQKNWFHYTIVLYCTQEKHYRFNVQKKEQPIYTSDRSPTSEVHAALTLLFPTHLYSDRSLSLKLLPTFLSDSLNYLPEKAAINVTLKATHIFSNVISDSRFSCVMILPSDDWEIPDSCDNLYLLISRFSHKKCYFIRDILLYLQVTISHFRYYIFLLYL